MLSIVLRARGLRVQRGPRRPTTGFGVVKPQGDWFRHKANVMMLRFGT